MLPIQDHMHISMHEHKNKPYNILIIIAHFIMTLNFLFLNIRSLPTHKPLFTALLSEEHINTFILNETHLTPKLQCKIAGYTLIRFDNELPALRANGGVAIAFSPHIAFRQYTPQIQNLPEHFILTLYYKQKSITTAAIYVRPVQPIPLDFLTYISNNFRFYIIMADINIHSRSDRAKMTFGTSSLSKL